MAGHKLRRLIRRLSGEQDEAAAISPRRLPRSSRQRRRRAKACAENGMCGTRRAIL